MSRGLDKLISELKGKCGDKYNIDGIQSQIKKMHESKPDEGMAVIEVEAVPVEEVEPIEEEKCPECGKNPCKCESESGEAEEAKLPEEVEGEQSSMESITETKEESEGLDDITPAEEDRIQEILKAIKTFFPNEDTEDVLVRLVQKLIDR